MSDLVKKLKSQIGDDVCEIYSHEALFSEAAAEITRLRAALTARDERMKAEGAREAQAKIARMEASLEILRDNPVAVHLNMLRGNIAKPTWDQIKHLYLAEFSAIPTA